jgi:hypothetical protein
MKKFLYLLAIISVVLSLSARDVDDTDHLWDSMRMMKGALVVKVKENDVIRFYLTPDTNAEPQLSSIIERARRYRSVDELRSDFERNIGSFEVSIFLGNDLEVNNDTNDHEIQILRLTKEETSVVFGVRNQQTSAQVIKNSVPPSTTAIYFQDKDIIFSVLCLSIVIVILFIRALRRTLKNGPGAKL